MPEPFSSPNVNNLDEFAVDVRRVDKPWGHEVVWALTADYCGKILFVRAGEALSLQFHNEKGDIEFTPAALRVTGRLALERCIFGDDFRCHPDGSISYLRRPVVDVQLSPDLSQLEPDDDAPVDLVHVAPDGTTSVIATGDLRMV